MRTERAFVCGLVLLLAGCGFQLRGSIDLPPEWQALHLESASPNSELTAQLRNQAAQAGIRWLPRDEANYVVRLGNEQFQSRNLSIGANARASEFELELLTRVRVTDSTGTEVLPETPFRTVQVIVNDPDQIAGVAEETRLLRDEMRVNLVQQILRKLRFLAAEAPAT